MKFLVFASAAMILAACGPGPQAAPAGAPVAEKTVEIQAAPTPSSAPPAPAATPGLPSPEFASLPEPYKSADYARGRRNFKLCQSCHLAAADAGHLVGPNLHGLFGRTAGSAPGFDYSDAVKNAGFAWTPEKLDEWLTNPNGFLPGNRMSFAGVRKPDDRTALIAYLMVETGASPAAPE